MNIPFVGQLVSFYPDAKTRLAALVIEVDPVEEEAEIRPNVSLQVFHVDGRVEFIPDAPATKHEPDEDEPQLPNTWSFLHEFPLELDEEDEAELMGTQTNLHVGMLSLE